MTKIFIWFFFSQYKIDIEKKTQFSSGSVLQESQSNRAQKIGNVQIKALRGPLFIIIEDATRIIHTERNILSLSYVTCVGLSPFNEKKKLWLDDSPLVQKIHKTSLCCYSSFR